MYTLLPDWKRTASQCEVFRDTRFSFAHIVPCFLGCTAIHVATFPLTRLETHTAFPATLEARVGRTVVRRNDSGRQRGHCNMAMVNKMRFVCHTILAIVRQSFQIHNRPVSEHAKCLCVHFSDMNDGNFRTWLTYGNSVQRLRKRSNVFRLSWRLFWLFGKGNVSKSANIDVYC